jgi:hypothetical protein
MLNKSVKDILANPVDINSYWINKFTNWHSDIAYVTEDTNDQADTGE